jgi:hypothetical protein
LATSSITNPTVVALDAIADGCCFARLPGGRHGIEPAVVNQT